MTGRLMAQGKEGTRVMTTIIPTFILRASLSTMSVILKGEAMETWARWAWEYQTDAR